MRFISGSIVLHLTELCAMSPSMSSFVLIHFTLTVLLEKPLNCAVHELLFPFVGTISIPSFAVSSKVQSPK